MANAEVPRTMSAALRDIAGMGERDVNAALAAANPTQQLSPRELVDMIRTWKARAEAAESEAEYLRAQRDKLAACLEECWRVDSVREAQALHDRARALLAEVRGK